MRKKITAIVVITALLLAAFCIWMGGYWLAFFVLLILCGIEIRVGK